MRRSLHRLFGAPADGAQAPRAPRAPTRTVRDRSSGKRNMTLGGVQYARSSRESCSRQAEEMMCPSIQGARRISRSPIAATG
jgi:hypothetical protein